MTKEEIIKITNAALIEKFKLDPSALKPESEIYGSLGFDSLDMVDAVILLEKTFKVKMSIGEEIEKLRTLSSLHNFVEKQIKKGQPLQNNS
jgi:acyl carrier protein